MYGKLFESTYSGSMIGMGPVVFSVWPYVIAKMRPDKSVGFQVELNPVLLSAIIGQVTPAQVSEAINRLCDPDPISRTEGEDGRRLIRVGSFDYKVVNGEKYARIRNEEERRTQNREAQARFREKHQKRKKKGKSLKTMDQWVKTGEYLDNRAAAANGEKNHE
jgi:hypothetical protein